MINDKCRRHFAVFIWGGWRERRGMRQFLITAQFSSSRGNFPLMKYADEPGNWLIVIFIGPVPCEWTLKIDSIARNSAPKLPVDSEAGGNSLRALGNARNARRTEEFRSENKQMTTSSVFRATAVEFSARHALDRHCKITALPKWSAFPGSRVSPLSSTWLDWSSKGYQSWTLLITVIGLFCGVEEASTLNLHQLFVSCLRQLFSFLPLEHASQAANQLWCMLMMMMHLKASCVHRK